MENFYRTKESRLTVAGLDRSYRILHISDSHISAIDALSTPEEAETARRSEAQWAQYKRHFANQFGEPFYPCHEISSMAAFDRVLDYCRAASPDLLVLAGDILDYIHPAGMRFLKERLSALPFPYLFVSGNHEGGCPDRQFLHSLTDGDSVQIRDFGAFRVLGIDDAQKTVSDDQLSTLQTLLKDGIPTIVVMHIPIATDRNRTAMSAFEEYYVLDADTDDKNGAALVKLLSESDSVIQLLCGHLHGMSETEIAPHKNQFCSSSALTGFVHCLVLEPQ